MDSHALFWWLIDHPRLSRTARASIADPSNDVFASAVTGYELGLKQARNRLSPQITGELELMIRRAGLPVLDISLRHAVEAAGLPGPHGDPFDRILMAQARVEELTVVTLDPVFDDYRVPTLW
ncbi:MAG: type II toxin-antitoxin system VapC family toxin [Pseudomonadota bacterium]